MKKFAVIIIIGGLFLFFQFVIRGGEQSNPGNVQCLECHASVFQDSIRHAPALKNCEYCHKSTGNIHPDTVTKTEGFALRSAVPDLCYTCHGPMNNKVSVHAPVGSGKCFACHSAHSATASFLLKYPHETICLECHDVDMAEKKSRHKAVSDGKCETCHDPHQADGKKLVRSEKPELCLNCHAGFRELQKSASVHPPFERNCFICHTGHSSEESFLLKEKCNDLCAGCHDDITLTVQESAHPHRAATVDDGCISCHSPHASDGKKLLPKDQTAVCLRCHSAAVPGKTTTAINMKEVFRNRKYMHGAIDSLGCSGCHPPHESKYPSLLIAPYPSTNYSVSVKDSSALCLTCHDEKLMTEATTLTATGFRNGDRNLHHLHTKGNNGRNCRACHDVHAANNKSLIAETVLFGEWQLPIKFQARDNGGSCMPGCHTEKDYNR